MSKCTLVKGVVAGAGGRKAFSRPDPLLGEHALFPNTPMAQQLQRETACVLSD